MWWINCRVRPPMASSGVSEEGGCTSVDSVLAATPRICGVMEFPGFAAGLRSPAAV